MQFPLNIHEWSISFLASLQHKTCVVAKASVVLITNFGKQMIPEMKENKKTNRNRSGNKWRRAGTCFENVPMKLLVNEFSTRKSCAKYQPIRIHFVVTKMWWLLIELIKERNFHFHSLEYVLKKPHDICGEKKFIWISVNFRLKIIQLFTFN